MCMDSTLQLYALFVCIGLIMEIMLDYSDIVANCAFQQSHLISLF
jgi:hypothetical protein